MRSSAASNAPSEAPGPLVVVCGPTGSGKSRLALGLAVSSGGEIVNADSRQLFAGMRIGTASPGPDERGAVPHHLYNILSPDEPLDVQAWRDRADRCIGQILRRGRLPVVVGGTGLYLRALIRGLAAAPPADPEVRDRVRLRIERHGVREMHSRLAEIDPEYAAAISPTDPVRVGRALEVYEITGRRLSAILNEHRWQAERYRAVWIAPEPARDELAARIRDRTRRMFEQGLPEEVDGLVADGFEQALRRRKAIGYVEVLDWRAGLYGMERAVELVARNTRRYARRQQTWFAREPGVRRYPPGQDARCLAETAARLAADGTRPG